MIKVFLVDDSATVRKVLRDILEAAPGIEVIGAAQDPIFAQKHLEKIWPDVFILDVEMPRMDGLTFLKKIMAEHPTPVVMCSTLTEQGSATSLKALTAGAIEVVEKPKNNLKNGLLDSSQKLINAVKAASLANVKNIKRSLKPTPTAIKPKLLIDEVIPKTATRPIRSSSSFIIIGASTGGTQALERVLTPLPATTQGIAIVQHMPEKFTLAFASRLNQLCAMQIKEAGEGDELKQGVVLIAPGGHHMVLVTKGNRIFASIKEAPPVNRHRPSVDVLFRSAAKTIGSKALGIILTGMGDDGARGLKEMQEAGAKTIAQNKDSCVVYGMPAEAVKLNAADEILDLAVIPNKIINF
jgi:two-component system chemotaxis response regulator CheB